MGGALTDWTPWKPIAPRASMPPHTLAELLDGGQTFRWNRLPGGVWEGTWGDHQARLRIGRSHRIECSAPRAIEERVTSALPEYLGLSEFQSGMLDALPWRSDPVLADAMRAFPGLRILRQPSGETLFCFLCSSSKRIAQIKAIASDVATRYGEPIPGGARRLPGWERIAGIDEDALRACRLGYRAAYIAATARILATHPGWLDETFARPSSETRARLITLPGVGGKIADCVRLFGGGQFDAFPLDTWILKAMRTWYNLHGWAPDRIQHFARIHFGPGAGLAQQYLYAHARANL